MEKRSNTAKRLSVRLSDRAAVNLEAAVAQGYNRSDYINALLEKSVVTDIDFKRKLMFHISRIESELELLQDLDTQQSIREELLQICRSLK